MNPWIMGLLVGAGGLLIAVALELNQRTKDLERKVNTLLDRQFQIIEKLGVSPWD